MNNNKKWLIYMIYLGVLTGLVVYIDKYNAEQYFLYRVKGYSLNQILVVYFILISIPLIVKIVRTAKKKL